MCGFLLKHFLNCDPGKAEQGSALETVVNHYSLVVCRNAKWEIEAIVVGEHEATAQARDLVSRDPLVAAIRVVRLRKTGVGIEGRPVRMIVPTGEGDGKQMPRTLSLTDPPRARSSELLRRWHKRGQKLVAAVVICAAAAMMLYGVLRPKRPWVFDSPEAQSSQPVHDTFADH